jgi:hypothetical protein
LTAFNRRFPSALKVFINLSAATFGPGVCVYLIYYAIACPAYSGGNDIPKLRYLQENLAPKYGSVIG